MTPLQRARRDFQDTVLLVFEDRIHWHEGDWYSRHPQTLTWVNDRKYGTRFRLLIEAVSSLWEHGDRGDKRLADSLSSRPSQYAFLAELAPRYWQLPPPADWDASREGV